MFIPINTVSPSEIEGLSLSDERKLRIYGCELIQDAGILLKLPQVTLATGQAILHRFYYRKSFIRCEVLTVATASLFLSAKIEENPRKLKDVVSVFDYVYKMKKGIQRPIPVIDINSFQFTDSKTEIVDAERFILKELGFQTYRVSNHNVHKFLLFYLQLLKGSKQLAQKAWNYINDSYRTICVVCFPANVVATSCLYLAAKMLNYPLPNLEWWKIFGAKFEDMEFICAELLNLYEIHLLSSQEVEAILNKSAGKDKENEEQRPTESKRFEKQSKLQPMVIQVQNQKEIEEDEEMEDQAKEQDNSDLKVQQKTQKDQKTEKNEVKRRSRDRRDIREDSYEKRHRGRNRERSSSRNRRRHRDDRRKHHRHSKNRSNSRDRKNRKKKHHRRRSSSSSSNSESSSRSSSSSKSRGKRRR